MKKMMFIAAIALCAMSCGNKPATTEEAPATDSAAVIEEVVDTAVVEEVAVDSAAVEVVDSAAVVD